MRNPSCCWSACAIDTPDLEFRAENDESLIRFEPGGNLHMYSSVEIAPQATEVLEKFPWLVSLGWYLIILLRSDSAAICASAST